MLTGRCARDRRLPLGGWLCDRLGWRWTGVVGVCSPPCWRGVSWLPPDTPQLVPLLALSFGFGGMARTAKMAAWRISATELFPHPALRAAVQGWRRADRRGVGRDGAARHRGAGAADGGLAPAASLVALLGIPAAMVFLIWCRRRAAWSSSPPRSTSAWSLRGARLEPRRPRRAARLALAALAATPGVRCSTPASCTRPRPWAGRWSRADLNAAARRHHARPRAARAPARDRAPARPRARARALTRRACWT
jgi:hypothetical protein